MKNRPYTLVIDPGHGGEDPGAVNERLDVYEKNINLEVALKVKERVEKGDYLYDLFLTREDDVFVHLNDRARLANSLGADAFLSIHCNAREGEGREGLEVEAYYYPSSKEGKMFAQIIMDYVVLGVHEKILTIMRGIKPANFLVLRKTNMPAVLIELGFITDDEEARFLNDPENQKEIASAIAEGCELFLEDGGLWL